MENIFAAPEYSFDKSEESHEQFWRAISSSLEEFNSDQIGDLIRYLLSHIPDYSALDSAELGIGMRMSSIVYTLLKLVDVGGWHDETGLHRNNTDENVIEIAQWVLGIAPHGGEGIIATLTSSDRGPIGWHDALVFRLYACADRNSSLFGIFRALALHADSNAQTTGVTTQLVVPQMRETSQAVFRAFREQYIEPRRNFLDETDKLDIAQLAGRFSQYVEGELAAGKIERAKLTDQAESSKTIIKAFTIYQLTNRLINSGIGCGYYDEFGDRDAGGIHFAMNDYLFNTCFAASPFNDGHFHFISYLTISFEAVFGFSGGPTRKASIAPNVLDQDMLRSYWAANRETIIGRKFEISEQRVVSPNYAMMFKDGVPQIVEMLDRMNSDERVADSLNNS